MEENLNLKIDEEVLKGAMCYAELLGIDLSVVVEDFLVRFVSESVQKNTKGGVMFVREGNCPEMKDEADGMVKEKSVSYQITKTISQAELDAECITLEESKKRILKRIHDHFHHS